MMESPNGSGNDTRPHSHHQLEKKRLNRAPSPARPFLKDTHSRSPKATAIVPKSPKLNKQQAPTGQLATQSRLSRRTLTGAKDKCAPAKSHPKSSVTKKAVKVTQHVAAAESKTASKVVDSSPHLAKSKKGRVAPLSHGPLGHGSPIRVPTGATIGRVGQTDSSSDLSDCPSEPLSDEQRLAQAPSSDAESGTGSGSSERDHVVAGDNPQQTASASEASGAPVARLRTVEAPGARGMSQASASAGAHAEKSKQDKSAAASAQFKLDRSNELIEEDLLREIEELRSENDYLKDEVDELRAEMEEVRDSYLEEEMYQLQELRRELDRSNKNCRILQYRLRKAEQRSLRAAQSGHVDGELLRSLEQDLKVAKDVSVRLHNELESVEDKRTRAEDENEMLRQKIIEVEISKQALHNELERRENALRRRGSHKDKKSATQEDSADLRCQLQFAKEESALMRKKMARLGRERDELEQDLQKYKSVYGDMDSPVAPSEAPSGGGGPHSTREAELRLRLRLVEEEANILGRKLVELEVESRGLRAENEDLRAQCERDWTERGPALGGGGGGGGGSGPASPYESVGELRRHLQFVEEEAELLRRSIAEMEDHNRQLTTELSRFKFGPGDGDGGEGAGQVGEGAADITMGSVAALQEELKAARLQINELSGKVLKLQYENRVLVSNAQRYDLASHLSPATVEVHAPHAAVTMATALREEEEEDEEDEEEEVGQALLLQPKREGPVGGESDSEEVVERSVTSGLGSSSGGGGGGAGGLGLKPWEADLIGQRRRAEEGLRREAERLGRSVDRLIADTDSLIHEGVAVVVTAASESSEECESTTIVPAGEVKQDEAVLETVSTRMKAFRAELLGFMERVERLGDGQREPDLSPLPHLTESSSFLSTGTSLSRDSPIGTLGRDLLADLQSGQGEERPLHWCLGLVGGCWREAAAPGSARRRGTPGHARGGRPQGVRGAEIRDPSAPEVTSPAWEFQFRLRPGQEDRENLTGPVTQQEARRGLELQGLQTHEAPWPQERALLQQEVRLFRHHTVVLYMKLRWILTHWRLGRRAEAGEEGAHEEYERLENIPELGVAVETGDGEGDVRPCAKITGGVGEVSDPGPLLPSPDPYQHQKQVGENRRVLHALRSLLEEFGCELREEEQRRLQLQQTYASERASWEIQRAEMRRRLAQLEEVAGSTGGGEGVSDPLKQEREEHRRLLAESHGAALELRWRLHHGERRWGRERQELLEHFHRERQTWMQRELALPEGKEGGLQRVCPPQENPCKTPRSPRSPRSHSDSEAVLEDRGLAGRLRPSEALHPGESLFLDALSLDPPSLAQVPPPSRLASEKRFPCLKEALNEISERAEPSAYSEEEPISGSLLRAKSVCSMSDFQRLMDSSPFLPDKSSCQSDHGGGVRDRGEVTPPLSPDDLKYIEEFNSKGWELATALSASCPIPGPLTLLGQQQPPPASALEAWTERTDPRRLGPADPTADPFQPGSWFLTTSATLTTSTLSSPEHCQRSTAVAPPGPSLSPSAQTAPEHFGVRVLHSPTRAAKDGGVWAGGGGGGGGGAGGYAAAAAAAAALELNLSDDMKEVAFSVRSAIRTPPHAALPDPRPLPPPPPPALRDSACQTNGMMSRGTQTCHAVSVGLQTDSALRALTSSPHRCLTPKGGGSTPVSSPSRSLRRPQYVPPGQAKFERPCCSPKYGSPKLQRKPSGTAKTEPAAVGGGGVVSGVSGGGGGGNSGAVGGGAGGAGGSSRTPTPTSTPQKGNNESAWARSTTTRDSPVHTTINDGLSSLFNIIDHTPLALEPAGAKFTRSPSRARPQQAGESSAAPPAGPDPKCASGGAVQELLRGSGVPRGRSPSPVQQLVIMEVQGSEVASIRQDLSAPPGHTLAENTARLLNRKLQEQNAREERRLQVVTGPAPGAHGRDPRSTDAGERAGCMEDLPRSPVAPPLEACFQRPARPANRRPPSRWAARSPNSSPTWRSTVAQRFRFPTQTIPELEEPSLEPRPA
ncbi:microtubule cross-linking factor 1 isoform X2 [Alosa sapidissima]|uniref:microtubule cross-linking factor 1 isoform X2 n=1 Tax=Alosa sapidissima TaxID=34773 RepID=UPI001C094949|nr:microtubule cross-linking factor 1 isoform X2 [Alosa sapidissima]